MDRPSADLLAEVFRGVKLTRDVGEFGTLLAIGRAQEALGFTPGTPGATGRRQSRFSHESAPSSAPGLAAGAALPLNQGSLSGNVA
jgi:hypothetical protein